MLGRMFQRKGDVEAFTLLLTARRILLFLLRNSCFVFLSGLTLRVRPALTNDESIGAHEHTDISG